jgi:hypothetical protein
LVCHAVGSGVASVFEGRVPESQGLRLLVGSLWSAILFASVLYLAWPAFFAPLILMQIFYKGLWFVLFVLPLVSAGKPFPVGISLVFVAIVVTYPVLLWLPYAGNIPIHVTSAISGRHPALGAV